MFGPCSEPMKANRIISYGIQDFQHQIRTAATKRRQLMTGRSALRSAVHANCWQTSNLLFMEVNCLGLQIQETNACNKWQSTNIRPAFLTAVDTCTHWLPVFFILLLQINTAQQRGHAIFFNILVLSESSILWSPFFDWEFSNELETIESRLSWEVKYVRPKLFVYKFLKGHSVTVN